MTMVNYFVADAATGADKRRGVCPLRDLAGHAGPGEIVVTARSPMTNSGSTSPRRLPSWWQRHDLAAPVGPADDSRSRIDARERGCEAEACPPGRNMSHSSSQWRLAPRSSVTYSNAWATQVAMPRRPLAAWCRPSSIRLRDIVSLGPWATPTAVSTAGHRRHSDSPR
jgi:hypothetical protein